MFRGSSGYGPNEDVRRFMEVRERHVNVFEDGSGGDAFYAVGGLDEVVAGATGLFATERVGKNERLGELTSTHQETGTVYGPLAF